MFGLFGPKTYESYVQPYALADGTYAYQARCECGYFSDLYVEEPDFVQDLRENHTAEHQ
ncbi:hypothetical protein [Nocardiopsis sp. FIRDI 009]|uniref:hypothetical protein n=1 Tax=Nocardiopsis sp. FIRDI 009 TaxID=714197 RepID=UPI0018E51853|nr:hypothetical protein [Nocardiopsis sp. FIRDI 009]